MSRTRSTVESLTTVERVSDSARLPALARAWDELIDERDPGAVFRSSAWLVPWWRRFSAGKELCIYTATDSAGLVGLLPAYRVKSPLGGSRLKLMGDGIVTSDYLGVIARPSDLAPVSGAIAQAVFAAERDLVLEGLTATDPLVSALHHAAREARRAFAALPDECPYIDIGAAPDFDDWLRDRPPEVAQLRRRRRWLERQPGFRIDILTGEAQIAAALPTLWELHRARWARDGGSKALSATGVEQFHEESARELARRGWARLYVLQVDGVARAALYGFERGGRFLYYQHGSPAWRQRSVGTVVLGAAVEDAFARGLKEFDFLRGVEGYKALYASSRRPLVTLRIAAGGRARASWFGHQGQLFGTALARELLTRSRRVRAGGRR
jgi:CelD/BcsL family acetyltransferase involved in cellulose biosynthesis